MERDVNAKTIEMTVLFKNGVEKVYTSECDSSIPDIRVKRGMNDIVEMIQNFYMNKVQDGYLDLDGQMINLKETAAISLRVRNFDGTRFKL